MEWATGAGQSPIAGTTIFKCPSNGFTGRPQNLRRKSRDGVQRSCQAATLRGARSTVLAIARGGIGTGADDHVARSDRNRTKFVTFLAGDRPCVARW